MVPGEPMALQRPVTCVGHRWRNPAHTASWRLVAALWAALAAFVLLFWLTDDPMPDCIDLPTDVAWPRLDYRGQTWWLDGRPIGTSPQEDSTCIRPV